MKKLNITKKHYMESKYFQNKYGKLEYVSESGRLYKTNKGKVLKFKESKEMSDADAAKVLGSASSTDCDAADMGLVSHKKADPYGVLKKRGKKVSESEDFNDLEKKFTWMGVTITRYDYESLPYPMAASKCPDRMMKHIAKSIYYDLKDNCGWSAKDIEKYLAPGVDEYDFEGQEARMADKIKRDFWEYMEKAAVSHGMEYYENAEYQMNESEDGKSEWFDANGWMIKTLPADCIEQCSGSGRKDEDVAFWVEELGFDKGLPREKTISFLVEYGAWDEDELNSMSETELAEKVLWIFANDLKEQAYEQSGDETSLVSDWGDVSDWGEDEWKKFQEEYGTCALSN